MAGLRVDMVVSVSRASNPTTGAVQLTEFFLWAARISVIGVGATGHVCQEATVADTSVDDAEAGVVHQTVVPRPAACLVAQGRVSAGDEALVQSLPRGAVAGAIADEDVQVAHICAGLKLSPTRNKQSGLHCACVCVRHETRIARSFEVGGTSVKY